MDKVVRAKRSQRLPVVLTRGEVRRILQELDGTPWLMASLMYGAGLRVLECARMRVKDLDLETHQMTVRDGKGRKDRVTVIPDKLDQPLRHHLRAVKRMHIQDLGAGAGSVALPQALDQKYPKAIFEWAWQWIFPASRLYSDPWAARRRRHHLHETIIQRAFKQAVRLAGISNEEGGRQNKDRPTPCGLAPEEVRARSGCLPSFQDLE